MTDEVEQEISIVVLTFNSAKSIRRTLAPLLALSRDIHVVDSFSSDDTVAICEGLGCQVTQRPFKNYSDQRNWTIDNLPLRHAWQLHVDADEELDAEAVQSIRAAGVTDSPCDAFIIQRKLVFMGKVLRFGGIAKTWHLRLFRRGMGRCEDRLYDQHFISSGRIGKLRGYMLDHQEDTLTEWTARHNRWSSAEAEEMDGGGERSSGQIVPSVTGNPIARKRYSKGKYYQLPLFWRVIAYTLYRYVIMLGFLDGRRGFIYHMLQGFWFRLLVDAKLVERRNAKSG